MPTVTVELPSLLARIAGEKHVGVDADTVGGALGALLATHPGLRQHLLDDRGELRANVLCAVDGEPTRLGAAERDAALADGATIVFVPSVAGG
jgi:molybdopterin converting factor small subunit